MAGKKMEGDEQQRRNKAREARRQGRAPSAQGATLGASKQRVAPTSVFAADPGARPVAEQLVGDAGFDPLYVGGLDNAPTLEAHIDFTMMLARGELGPYFYRFASPGDL